MNSRTAIAKQFCPQHALDMEAFVPRYTHSRRKNRRHPLEEHRVGQTADAGTVNKSKVSVPAKN